MKIYVHIKSYAEFFDRDVMIPIECDTLPSEGQEFFLSDEDQALLEWKAILHIYSYCEYIYGWEGAYHLSFSDVEMVDEVLWRKGEDGKYYPHIQLKMDEDRDIMIDYGKITDELYSQIKNNFFKEHPTFNNNQ